MTNIKTYIISLDDIDLKRILETWTWLTGENKTVIALTKLGDALLKDTDNKLYFLNTGEGDLKTISENYMDFINAKLDNEVYEELFLPTLVDELNRNDKQLLPKQVYSFYKLPLLGGTYDTENIYVLNLYEHYNLTGEIHLQLKDLPDGTKINIKTVE